jgi:hypothetical protein
VRAKEPLATIAVDVCDDPAFTSRYGTSTASAFVAQAFRDVLGRAPTAAEARDLTARVTAGTLARSALLADLVARPEAAPRFAARVDVLMTYAGLLRRRPDSGGWSYWVPKVQGGTSIQRLIAQFFSSSEYRRRFDG